MQSKVCVYSNIIMCVCVCIYIVCICSYSDALRPFIETDVNCSIYPRNTEKQINGQVYNLASGHLFVLSTLLLGFAVHHMLL